MTWRKRIFDLFFASLLVVILGPILLGLLVWLLVKEGRPLFHVAERMKTPEESFKLWKLRTMTVAEEDQGVSGGNKAARITPTGAWLRARRLDEFPQLLNILRGDLSFVGPRPPLREYVERFPEVYGKVLKSGPALPVWPQSGFTNMKNGCCHAARPRRNRSCLLSRLCPAQGAADLIYQRHQSVCYDFDLVFQTISNLFRRS